MSETYQSLGLYSQRSGRGRSVYAGLQGSGFWPSVDILNLTVSKRLNDIYLYEEGHNEACGIGKTLLGTVNDDSNFLKPQTIAKLFPWAGLWPRS